MFYNNKLTVMVFGARAAYIVLLFISGHLVLFALRDLNGKIVMRHLSVCCHLEREDST